MSEQMLRMQLQDTYSVQFRPIGGLQQREQVGLAIANAIEQNPMDISAYSDFVDFINDMKSDRKFEEKSDLRDFWIGDNKKRHGLTTFVKMNAQFNEIATGDPVWGNAYNDILKFEAYYLFESFLFYMEQKRPYERRFYAPRRHALKVVVDDLQDLEDGKYIFYGLSMPVRTGKSTICIFFLAWVGFKKPRKHNAMCGHSGMLADGFYSELCNLILTSEYTFEELYKDRHNGRLLQSKSAEKHTLNLLSPDRFATFTCRGIDGTWTGDVDVSGYLYVDDLVRDREQSLSPRRMENLWQEFLNKVLDRMNDGAKMLMVGTLWGITDPLERYRTMYENDPRYKFRRIPALDENDESNFNYEIGGFSTEHYRHMRQILADAEWQAKFMQRPYAREGLLFAPDELRYFNGILPDGDHKIYTACDVAWGGGDRLSMPLAAEYPNGDVYVFDWIFNGGTKATTQPLVAGAIMANSIYEITFEANNGGGEYCADIDKMLQKVGYRCSCTSKRAPGTMEKMQKIIANADDIKRNFIFLSATLPTEEEEETDRKNGIKRYKRSVEYQQAMDELCSYSTVGKNEHDDAADGLTQLNIKRTGGYMGQLQAMQRPW